MPSVLICARDPLMAELHGTLLWRSDVDRHVATRLDDALVIAVAAQPDLVVVERELPQAARLVRDLRAERATHRCSIAVLAAGELDPVEIELLEAGANAILRMPVSPEWDPRLAELMLVPRRRSVRVPVQLEFEVRHGAGVEVTRGSTLNVSATGLLVQCATPLPVGTDLDLRVFLPRSTRPVVGCARVVREGRDGRCGLRFYGLEGDGAERLRRLADG